MATRIEEILGRDINSLKELREEIKRLQDSIASVDPTSKEFKDTTTKLIAAQEQLTSVTRAGKDENVAAKDSIVGMEKEYKALYNTYKMLTEEQRNSDFGQNMAESLNTLSNKLNETKKGVGNFKDNIGRYTDSIMDAFKQMGVSLGGLSAPLKLATTGVKGLNTALKANPIMAIVGAIQLLITVVKKMKDAISQNEELQMRWNQAMSAFQPIADAMANAVQKIAEQFVKFVEKIADALRWVREAKAAVTDFLGLTKGAKKAVQEQNKVYQDIAKSQNELIKNKREYQKLNAADEAEVQRLREEASETANLEERKKILTEAKEIQAQIDQRNIEVAKEELRILEEQAQLTANDAAMNDKLAAATAAVSQAEATAANNMRAFNKQLGLQKEQVDNYSSSVDTLKEQAKSLYEELIEDSKSEVQKLTEKYQKEKALLEKYHYDTTLLTKKYEKDMQKIRDDAAAEEARKLAERRQREREDREKEWEILNASTANDLEYETSEKALEKLKSVKRFIDDLGHQYADAVGEDEEKANKLLEILNKLDNEGIQALANDFPNLIDAVDELNDKFGITITTSHSLENAIEETKKRLKELNDEAAQIRIDEKFKDSKQALYDDLLGALNGNETDFARASAEAIYYDLQAQKDALEAELTNTKVGYDKKLELMEQYYDVVAQLRQSDWDAETAYIERLDNLWTDGFDALNDIQSSILTVVNAYSSLIQAQLNEGKITEEQAKKKKKTLLALEKVALAVNIAQIAASTAAGIMDVWKGYATETASNAVVAAATGPAAPATLAALNTKSRASAILKTTGLISTGLANIAAATMGTIAKVSAMKGGDEGSASVPVQASVAEIDSTPYTYTRQMQTAEEEDAIYNKNIWVSVTDIESGLDHKVKVTDESSF